MGSILKFLESLSETESMVQRARKQMSEGETWVYPIQLKKGVEYSLSAACSRRATSLRCSLLDGHAKTLGENKIGTTPLSVIPEEDGLYKLMVVRDSTGNDSRPENVIVIVKKKCGPARVRAQKIAHIKD